jgi:putative hydrolase of the HAD superfamily
MQPRRAPIWLFDLDNTLHDASQSVFRRLNGSMTDYIVEHLGHGIRAAHFLAQTHELPGLEGQLRMAAVDRAALKRLPGRKFLLTNAPADYARRVLTALDLASCFEGVIAIDDMRMFGRLRPKPDTRMLRHVLARLKLPATRCVLVEDTVANLRSARRLGLRTVWMQRYLRHNPHGPEAGLGLHARPACVDQRVRSLHALRR